MLTGLVVGKFCPLHKGHEALIDFARAHSDRLVILSYTKPEFVGFPTERRAAWLAALYPDAIRLVLDDEGLAALAMSERMARRLLPHNDAPDEEHRAFVAWVCRALLGLTVDRVFTSELYGDGFAASLAAYFGHPVEHLMFDPSRRVVPISGTRMRNDPSLHGVFLARPVRRDLVRRVALIGGESTGKTTLAAALAKRLGTTWVPEYGRELWERRGGKLEYADLLAIGREQVAREEAALDDAAGWLVCDTSPLVTMFYSEAMFGQIDSELIALAARPYDMTFLCAADFPFVQDGTRRDPMFRQRQHDWYDRSLAVSGVPCQVIGGPLNERVQTASRVLAAASAATSRPGQNP